MNVVERAKDWLDPSVAGIRTPDNANKLITDLLSIVERLRGVGSIGFTADGKVVVEGDALHWPDGSEAKFSHVADTGGARFRTMPKQGEILGELVSANNAYSTRAAAEAAREGE